MIRAWFAVVCCLAVGFATFMLGLNIGEDSKDPASECYYEIYTVSIVDTLGEQRNVSGVKFISERDGYLTLYDMLGDRYFISIRDNIDYVKCTVTDSVRCEGEK